MLSVLPTPLHAALVHMPIALAVLVPLFAVGALWFIRRGAVPARAWGLTVAMLAALLASGFVALQTGKRDEGRVERVIGEQPIETHEEAAELFLVATGLVLVLAGGGLLRGKTGSMLRGAATVGTLALVGAGWNVGHSGGALVYTEGAASAYTATGVTGPAASDRSGAPVRRGGDDDDAR